MKPVIDVMKKIDNLTELQWKELYLEHARGDRSDIVPFPSEEIQVITNGLKGEITAMHAISIFDCLMSCVNEVLPPTKEMRILDYGCGWGRMTRLLPFYFNINCITGVDVNERLVNSANELLPHMNHRTITSMEPLPFVDDSFDIIYANSVFSHLSEKSCRFTLSELGRILSKEGILIISVLEENNMIEFYSDEDQRNWITKILGEQKEAASKLKRDGFVWSDTGRWHEYGIAIMNDGWITERLEAVGVKYLGTKRGTHERSQNYKFGIKLEHADF